MSLTNKFFFCYDENLKNFLHNNGVDFITHARAINTNRKFWLFESSSVLTRLINDYKMKTPKVGGKTTMVGNTP